VSIETLVTLVSSGTILWIASLLVILVWKLLTGAIDLGGLLEGDRADGSTYFSAGRVQLLVATTLFGLHLLMQVIANPTQFPSIPHEYLMVLGGSQGVYLLGKARAMLR
jgi:hypothetical protein